MNLDDVKKVYGCSCPSCVEKYNKAQLRRDPYYRAPQLTNAEAEALAYDPNASRCNRDPYARDPNDDGGAGW